MKKFYINKTEKKLYSVEELSELYIQYDTFIKEEFDNKWRRAEHIEELKSTISVNESDVYHHIYKASIHKAERIVGSTLRWSVFLLLLIGVVVSVDNLIFRILKYMIVLLGFLYVSYPLFLNRYFKIVKRESSKSTNTKYTYYYIYECFNFKKEITDLNIDKLKWKRSNFKKHKNIDGVIDKLKIIAKENNKNQSIRIQINPELAVRKSSFFEYVREKNRIIRILE